MLLAPLQFGNEFLQLVQSGNIVGRIFLIAMVSGSTDANTCDRTQTIIRAAAAGNVAGNALDKPQIRAGLSGGLDKPTNRRSGKIAMVHAPHETPSCGVALIAALGVFAARAEERGKTLKIGVVFD